MAVYSNLLLHVGHHLILQKEEDSSLTLVCTDCQKALAFWLTPAQVSDFTHFKPAPKSDVKGGKSK